MNTKTEDKLARAMEQAVAQYHHIAALVERLHSSSDDDAENEKAREEIQEHPLSVQVRSGWYQPGADKPEPEEYEIMLCTGGPAVRIIGDLSNGSPDTANIEVQDWFTPWTEWKGPTYCADEEVLMAYVACFWFGE